MPVRLSNTECSIASTARSERHRPEQTRLYQAVERHISSILRRSKHEVARYVTRPSGPSYLMGELPSLAPPLFIVGGIPFARMQLIATCPEETKPALVLELEASGAVASSRLSRGSVRGNGFPLL